MAMLDGVISEIGSRFGVGDKARQLVGYLLSYMTSPAVGGLGGFLAKLKNLGLGSILGNSTAALSGGQVNSLFGGTIGTIASRLGLSESAVTSAAGMAVPAMLAKLAPGGVAPASLPAEVTDLARQYGAPVSATAGEATQSAWTWLAWLLPLLGLGLLALYLAKGCQMGTPTAPSNPTPPTPPAVTVPDVDRVKTDVQGLFTDATKALTDVTSADTAKAALPELTKLETRVEEVRAMADKLPAAGKETIRSLAGVEVGKLQAIVDRIKNLGGAAWDAVGPVIARLMDKFRTLGA